MEHSFTYLGVSLCKTKGSTQKHNILASERHEMHTHPVPAAPTGLPNENVLLGVKPSTCLSKFQFKLVKVCRWLQCPDPQEDVGVVQACGSGLLSWSLREASRSQQRPSLEEKTSNLLLEVGHCQAPVRLSQASGEFLGVQVFCTWGNRPHGLPGGVVST